MPVSAIVLVRLAVRLKSHATACTPAAVVTALLPKMVVTFTLNIPGALVTGAEPSTCCTLFRSSVEIVEDESAVWLSVFDNSMNSCVGAISGPVRVMAAERPETKTPFGGQKLYQPSAAVELACTKLLTVYVPRVPVVQVPEDTAAMSLRYHAKATEDATMFASPAPVDDTAD